MIKSITSMIALLALPIAATYAALVEEHLGSTDTYLVNVYGNVYTLLEGEQPYIRKYGNTENHIWSEDIQATTKVIHSLQTSHNTQGTAYNLCTYGQARSDMKCTLAPNITAMQFK